MAKILIGINNLTQVSQLAYANHCQLWYRLGKSMPEHEFALCNPRRMSIDHMRNFCARAVLEHGFTHLLFLDDDVLVPQDSNPVKKLLEADKNIIAGVTLIRGYPYHPMIFNFMGPQLAADGRTSFVDDYAERADAQGLLRVDAVGFSCCLIKAEVLRGMLPPFFVTLEGTCTEDVYFCNEAKKQRPQTEVWVDTTIKTSHILGEDIIDPDNIDARKMYEEFLNPGLAEGHALSESKQSLTPRRVQKREFREQHVKKLVFG